jgi:25S rRNA (adenine2142-N1)-methyltransferase
MVGGSGEKFNMSKANAPHKKKKNQKGKAVPLAKPPKPSKKSEEKQKHPPSDKSTKSSSPYFSSTSDSLELIKSYHTLNKRLEQNARDDSLTDKERQRECEKIEEEQQALGGIERYQQASMYGAKFNKFNCAHWVEPLLREHFFGKVERPRILDVGAIDNQYQDYNWFDAVAIDLNSQHPSVIKADFFDYAHEDILLAKEKPFDALILSLVLNFQGDPRRRGDMLALAADERLLTLNGLLFVALPSASLDNSRYCDEEYLILICKTLCLEVVERKRSAKLTLLTFRRTGTFKAYNAQTKTFDYGDKEMGRSPAKPGKQRNNFAVMLKTSTVPR